MNVVLIFLIGIIAFIIGFMCGYSLLGKKKKVEFRKHLTQMIKYQTSYNYDETRQEPRTPKTGKCEITLPQLDSAGVAMTEEVTVSTALLNISRNGCAVISQQFIKPGLDVLIKAQTDSMVFGPKKAEVRYNHPVARGLQIGLEFENPIDTMK